MEFGRWAPLAVILACLVVLKAYGLHDLPGDEGIYFYLAKRMAEDGLIPYRDFFFAHPPVHLLVAAGAFKIFGVTSAVGKAIPAFFSLVTVAIVYAACLRRLGAMAAFVAACVLATSYDYLRASSHFTGVNVTLALATAAAVLCLERRPAAGGAMAALAASAGLYALPTAIGCGVVVALEGGGKRAVKRFLVGLLAVAVVIDGGFWWAAGQAFVDQVWLYHLAKPGEAWAGVAMGRRVIIDNLGPTVGAAMALGLLPLGRWMSPSRRFAGLALLLGLGNLLALASLQRAFPFYFLMMLPGFAVAAGFAAQEIYSAVAVVLTEEWAGLVVLVAAALIAVATFWGASEVRDRWHPRTLATAAKGYAWAAADPLPGWVNRAVRNLLWLDVREADTHYVGVRRYLWHESRRWPLFPDIVRYVEEFVPPDATFFGGSLSAPYLAFLSGRRVAGDEADSNAARFRSGVSKPADVIKRVEADGPVRLIVRPGRGIHRVAEFRRWMNEKYRVERTWEEPRRGRLLLMRPR